MILTVAQTYPTKNNMYNNGFVHARIKAYKNEGIEANAYVLNNKYIKNDYKIEGVNVIAGDIDKLVSYVNNNKKINCVCFHFLNISMLKAMQKIRGDVKIVIFVHGNEALWWYQRIFPDRFNGIIRILKFIKYVFVNSFSLFYIRSKLNRIEKKVNIVCVSEWMKDMTLRNWKIDEKKIKIHIIPNFVNGDLFKYYNKDKSLRYNILLIRQFTSGKYALDVAMDIINKLEEYPEAKKIKITIIGRGWLYKKYVSRIKHHKNISYEKNFLSQKEIALRHRENGIFLCPTRQDAQGVSMCEAMSSGLVPISSPNTAIPEFLPQKLNLAFTDSENAAERIIEIIRNPEEFSYLSKEVSDYINNKCSRSETIQKEIELISSEE